MTLVVSIVSHGHGVHVQKLLTLLARPGATSIERVWLTLNIPEPALSAMVLTPWPFELRLLINSRPLGFGANHNQAFEAERNEAVAARWFAVLNPDMHWAEDPFPSLLQAANECQAGCAYPRQLDMSGMPQDHRRAMPTPANLWARHRPSGPKRCEMRTLDVPDWVNAAFLLFPADVLARIGGFDERYFMYCEDVDLCLRLQLAGYRLIEAPQARVVHDARRASRSNLLHLFWHLRSLWRLWRSEPYRRFLAERATVTIKT